MTKYRTSGEKIAKSVTVALTLVFAMVSSVTAHAAGIGVAEANDKFLEENQEIVMFEEPVVVDEWTEQMVVETSEDVEIVYVNDVIMYLGGASFSWSVPANTRYVTSSIYFAEGTEVQISCTATPKDCVYWFGLMAASSTCYVVEGTGSGSYDFTVPSSGYYRIMVENRSDETINVNGGYSY